MKSDETLDGVREWLGRYILTVNDSDLDLLTLWAAHTHLANETYSSPRLLLDSPMPGSGKTTCLEHLARLCVAPVQMAAVSSSALLVRLLQDKEGNPLMRTLLIDEVDRTLRPDKETTPDLIAILNSGYKRGATRPVLVPVKGGGWESQEMPTFAPVAMAGNSPQMPEDTRSRTIRVLLLPDLEGRVQESDWELIDDDARLMGESLAQWAEKSREYVAATRPPMPDGIIGRFREKWQPLARVAAAAGGRWPDVVNRLALQDHAQFVADREDGMLIERPHIVLLRHLHTIWPDSTPFITTTQIVEDLADQFPDSWGSTERFPKGLTIQRFGRMMATHYKVNSGRLTTGDKPRGYFYSDLEPVMARLGVTPSIEPVQPETPAQPAIDSEGLQRESQPDLWTTSTSSTGLAGSKQTPPTEPVTTCKTCKGKLTAANQASGYHPNCDPEAVI